MGKWLYGEEIFEVGNKTNIKNIEPCKTSALSPKVSAEYKNKPFFSGFQKNQ